MTPSIVIRFEWAGGMSEEGIAMQDAFPVERTFPAVPRVGDTVTLEVNGVTCDGTVRHVFWGEHDIIVRFR